MKNRYFLALIGVLLLWTAGEIGYRAGYSAGHFAAFKELTLRDPPPIPEGAARRHAEPPPPPGPPQIVVPASAKERQLPHLEIQLPHHDELHVLVMPGGALYHKASCKKVKGGVFLRFSEAIAQGYRACQECGGLQR
ncbi:MAG: hypothetical protein QM758_06585 [Armatimonas sp.]